MKIIMKCGMFLLIGALLLLFYLVNGPSQLMSIDYSKIWKSLVSISLWIFMIVVFAVGFILVGISADSKNDNEKPLP